MQINTIIKPNKKYTYYICSTHKKYKTCVYKNINIEYIQNFVLCSLQNQIASFLKFEDTFNKEELVALSNRKIFNINYKIELLMKDKEVKNNYILKCYEDYVSSLICYDEYNLFKSRFMEGVKTIEITINNLEKEKLKIHKNSRFDEIFEIYKKYENVKKIDRAMVICFIEKIIVYENYKIQIVFKYNDDINLLNQHYSFIEAQVKEGV